MSLQEKPRKRVSVVVNDAETSPRNTTKPVNPSTGPRFGCRHGQAILLCLAFLFGIGCRNNISVALVAMTDNTTSLNPNIPYYDWNNTNVVISAFYWGYIFCQVPAGYLGKTYGPKYFLLGSFLLNSFGCALIPLMAEKFGSTGVICCRVLQGICQGFLYPSIQVMLGTWAPSEERSTLNNFIYAGTTLGSIYGSLVTGYVSSSWLGWPYSFYILALFSFLWSILWLFLGYDSPAVHPRITDEEKVYIQKSLKQEDDVDLPIPWRKIFACVPFYAAAFGMVGNTYGASILSAEAPTYLSKMMSFNIKSNALIMTLPSCLGLTCSFFTGPLSDWLIRRQYLTRLWARRIFHLIGSFGYASCLLGLAFLTKSAAILSIVALGMTSVFAAFLLNGANINQLDLSPRFCGIIFAILNAVSQCTAIIAPLIAQWVITDKTDATQWRIVFGSGAASFMAGGVVFTLFSSATRQPWDGPTDKELEQRRKKISVISLTIT
ncbi:putative inorganic phosphate cotransporter [Anthonomus grandis grandis]|uniref:putative inorganic phosphate cotransporter n=1 Tax=Anthonomus grandis grandis TaxID=2921223 RepID=UPI002165984E|nr:putative inorganic phosphate cotransporter [Anthonomus grandis grandis]